MESTQTAVGTHVLIMPYEGQPTIKRVYGMATMAGYGEVVDAGESDFEDGDMVYYNPTGNFQVGDYLAVHEAAILAIDETDETAEQEDVVSQFGNSILITQIVSTQGRAGIFTELEGERRYQDGKWGGPEADDKQTQGLWMTYLRDYTHGIGSAIQYEDDFRTRMIKVAALAIAAVESHDRKAEIAATQQNAACAA